jgi:hypothetical protein
LAARFAGKKGASAPASGAICSLQMGAVFAISVRAWAIYEMIHRVDIVDSAVGAAGHGKPTE